jgi:dihydrofolate reductase
MENVDVASSLTDALGRIRGRGFGRVFIIGGAEVYREAVKMENCNRILFTEVHGEVETDVEFPVEFRDDGRKRSSHEALQEFVGGDVVQGSIVEGDLSYEFQMWEKKNEVKYRNRCIL